MIIDFRNTFFICEGELNESRTCKFDLHVQIEENRTIKINVKIYNLEMIIAFGFRTKTSVGNSFRIWANKMLNEFMKKVLNICVK